LVLFFYLSVVVSVVGNNYGSVQQERS